MYILAALMLLVPVTGRAADISASVQESSKMPGTLSGQLLTTGGEPLAGGSVYFFDKKLGPPPDYVKYWRVPDFKQQLDENGKFSLYLPAGTYYMGATRRISGKVIGPPKDGDFYFISSDEKGVPRIYEVQADARMDLGVMAKGVPFKSSTVSYGKDVTDIEGVVLDKESKPVAGALVLAFASPSRGVKPLFTSEPIGKDGSFIIRVHDSGLFYLKVRSMYGGGPPVTGEMVGMYGDRQPMAITVKKGERQSGLAIRTTTFPGKGPQPGPVDMPRNGKQL